MKRHLVLSVLMCISACVPVPPPAPVTVAPLPPSPAPARPQPQQVPDVKVPTGCVPSPGTQAEPYSNTGYAAAVIHEKTGMELVFIPAGSFNMGSQALSAEIANRYGGRAEWYDCEHPQHQATLASPLYLGRYEVTNAQYTAFVKASGYDGNPDADERYLKHLRSVPGALDSGTSNDPQAPVVWLSWMNANAFCLWAGLRLPSETEWEYACRAGSGTEFHFGDDLASLNLYDWTLGNSQGLVHPVGQLKPNRWGLFDMHGNVSEWCEDMWHGDYNGAPGDGSAWVKGGEKIGGVRDVHVVRGGAWNREPRFCRSALRGDDFQDFSPIQPFGFRCALGLE